MKIASCLSLLGCALASAAWAAPLGALVDPDVPSLVATYQDLHAHPELSMHEERTAALLATELRKVGYAVTERVGRYPDGTQAYGVVAILENGPGPRLAIRADLDALPVTEDTGLPYASQVRAKNAAGQEVGVMHACGHDVHVTTMIGTARVLAATRSKWHGTLMLIGQPAEETAAGSIAMLADRLYERFGRPDMVIGLHDSATRAAGTVGVAAGAAAAGMTAIDVTLRGIGGHGAEPQNGKDPVVMAGEFIMQLQTIVSRQENPRDPAVVTVGTIHGGTKRNIIPDEVRLELTTRAFSDKAIAIIVDGVRRTAAGVALAAGVPEDRAPIVNVMTHESLPPTYNDPALSGRVHTALVGALGAANVFDEEPAMFSEDFGLFGLAGHQIPTVLFFLGANDPDKFAAAKAAGQRLPGLHTSRFQPLPAPTLRTGVLAMASVATALLQR
ncbi:MAG: amidohydrolase [Pseudomonadota bacterium]